MALKQRTQIVFTPEQQLYQSYSAEEDRQRTNLHYDRPVEFFYRVTGGEWNVYSCNLWTEAIHTDTESQEAKLDLLAQLMELKPGQRILDIGCGWGGPLAYLCKTYNVRGVGLTLSPLQKHAATERITRYGIDAQIIESHWRDYYDQQGFDVVFTDEVIVHFNDLSGFFSKVHALLQDGGRMVNKELHLTHPKYSEMTRAMSIINEIFGSTGNYRTLAEELTRVGEAGFEVRQVYQIPCRHYQTTVDRWENNLLRHRAELEGLAGSEYYRRFRTYLKLCYHIHGGHRMTLDIVVAHKLSE